MIKRVLLFVALVAMLIPALAFQATIVATRIRSGASTPATCAVSDVFYKTGASSGLYECTATNTWTLIAASPVSMSASVTGVLDETNGGTGQSTITQGDLLYGSAANTVSKLAKDATATRYLANTGTSNSPAWAQVNIANGVTGNLAVTHLNSGTSASSSTFWRGDGTWATPAGGGGGTVDPGAMGHVLTLAPGNPNYAPQPATAASTDTTAETVTFAAEPGWVSGTIGTPTTTEGGLTAGTRYFIHNTGDDLEFSFHTTVAAAMDGSSPVNLTADITSVIKVSGISTTQICITPKSSSLIPLYVSSAWTYLNSAEVCEPLGTLSNNTNYDVRVQQVMGMAELSFLAWTDATHPAQRATQDGAVVDAMDQSYRIVGSFRTNSTTTTIDDAGGLASQVGGKRFVDDAAQPRSRAMTVINAESQYGYNTDTWRQENGNAGNQAEWISALPRTVTASSSMGTFIDTSGKSYTSIGLDSTTAPHPAASVSINQNANLLVSAAHLSIATGAGYHKLVKLEKGSGDANSYFYPTNLSQQFAVMSTVVGN